MLLDKFLKAVPICDFVPIPLLEVSDGLTVSRLFLSFQPQV
jgi:hypothetical protein